MARRPALRRHRALASLLLLAGCAGATPVDPVAVPAADSSRAFVVFRGDTTITVDHLRVAAGELIGQRVPDHPGGLRPIIIYPMATVDSVTEAHLDRNGLALFAIPIAVVVGVIVALRASWGSD